MKLLYVRCYSSGQNSSRQTYNSQDYDHIIEDTCSGSIALFQRTGGMEIKNLINKGVVFTLLGRAL